MSKGNIFFGQPIFSQMIGLLDRNKVNPHYSSGL